MSEVSIGDTFGERGVVRVRDAFSRDAANAMLDTIWQRVEAHTPARRQQPDTWHQVRLPSFKPIKQRPAFRPLIDSPALATALDVVFGLYAWEPSGSGVQVLVTFPNTDTWTLPHYLWHMDAGFGPAVPTEMVKVFCCVDTVAVGGGGTLALAGSHRLVDRYSNSLPVERRAGNSVSWRRFLNTDPWTRELVRAGDEPARTNRLMGGRHDADGIDLEIIEMTGEPGDVYITDIHTFHCVAPNASDRPRIMLGAVYRRSQINDARPT
jgi:Phytanoyl-CoA dioxygenase (PhyH)